MRPIGAVRESRHDSASSIIVSKLEAFVATFGASTNGQSWAGAKQFGQSFTRALTLVCSKEGSGIGPKILIGDLGE
jgi:hypothetical protein